MATYRLFTFALDEEFEAPSAEEARRIAALMVRRHHLPDRILPRWIEVSLVDEEGVLVDEWLEAVQPKPPECVPLLAGADRSVLELLWRVRALEEDGHLWACPPELVEPTEEPEDADLPELTPSMEVCLRCGTIRWTNPDAVDPVTGTGGLRAVDYSVGWYADEIVERWAEMFGEENP